MGCNTPFVKICGIKNKDALLAASESGAKFVGFNFIKSSRNYVTPEEAQELLVHKGELLSVALFCDPTDEELDQVLSVSGFDYIQLHGEENYDRVKVIAARYKRPVIKAIPVSDNVDMKLVEGYEAVADMILFDTHSKSGQTGGTGEAFNWTLLRHLVLSKPWMLAGGLTSDNVREALQVVSPAGVDVSSGVDAPKGCKSPEKISRFIQAVQNA